MTQIILIAHNLRSTHNVGSLFRTCEGLGVQKLYLTGYTPYPLQDEDERMPHLAQKIDKQIHKTALDAEKLIPWQHHEDILKVIEDLKGQAYLIAGLEQAPRAIQLPDFKPPEKLALIIGREVEGIEPEILALCQIVIEIPMLGQKESFNVVQAAAMALYHCRYH